MIDSLLKESNQSNETNPHMEWEIIKYEIRKVTIKFSKENARKKRSKYIEIEKNVKDIEEKDNWEM